jgi:hypothetical protein
MGTISDGLDYLSRRREANRAERAERARIAAEKREAERQRREAERKELLERLTERLEKRFGWVMKVVGYGRDEWGDPVYQLDDGTFITITDRDPTVYKRKPKEDAFRNARVEWRFDLDRLRDDILRSVKEERAQKEASGDAVRENTPGEEQG